MNVRIESSSKDDNNNHKCDYALYKFNLEKLGKFIDHSIILCTSSYMKDHSYGLKLFKIISHLISELMIRYPEKKSRFQAKKKMIRIFLKRKIGKFKFLKNFM